MVLLVTTADCINPFFFGSMMSGHMMCGSYHTYFRAIRCYHAEFSGLALDISHALWFDGICVGTKTCSGLSCWIRDD